MWDQAVVSVTALADSIAAAAQALKAIGPVIDSLAERAPGVGGVGMARAAFDARTFTTAAVNMYENFAASIKLAADVVGQAAEAQKLAPGSGTDTSAGLAAMSLIVEQLACFHRDSAALFVPQVPNFKKFKTVVVTGQLPVSTPRAVYYTDPSPVVASAPVPIPIVVTPPPTSPPQQKPPEPRAAPTVAAPSAAGKAATSTSPTRTKSPASAVEPSSRLKQRGRVPVRGRRAEPESPPVPTDTQVYGALPLRIGHRTGTVAKERRRLGDLNALVTSGELHKELTTALEGTGPASTLRAWLLTPEDGSSVGDQLSVEMMVDTGKWDVDEASGAGCRVHYFGEGDSWVEHFCFVTVNGVRTAVYHHLVATEGIQFEAAVSFTASSANAGEVAIAIRSGPLPESDALSFFLQTLMDLIEARCKAASPPSPPKVDADVDDDEGDEGAEEAPSMESTARPAAAVAAPPPQQQVTQQPVAAMPAVTMYDPVPLFTSRPTGYNYAIEVPSHSGMSPTHDGAPNEAHHDKAKASAPGTISKLMAAPMSLFSKSQQLAMFEQSFPEIGEEVIETWNCAWRDGGRVLKQGILYLTKTYLCFTASVLTAKFFVELRDIENINKGTTAVVFDNAIVMRTLTGEEYTLVSFLTRDAAYDRIRAHWLEA